MCGSREALLNCFFDMTPLERLNRALVIRKALTDLMTAEEAEAHEGITDYLEDYVRDLVIDYENSMEVDLPAFLS
jgi:hypothetical protein